MRVLFVHQNFPGQYLHLAPALAARGDEVVALSIEAQKPPPGVRVFRYRPRRRYDLRGVCLPRHIPLVDAVASGRPPPDAGAEIAGSARPARVSLSLTPTLSRRRERVALHEQAQPIDPSPVRPSRAGEGADRQLAPPNPLPSGEGASEASG